MHCHTQQRSFQERPSTSPDPQRDEGKGSQVAAHVDELRRHCSTPPLQGSPSPVGLPQNMAYQLLFKMQIP